eukprot:COSAG06_NODE_37141_length_438_cov_4.539823_1_plen_145_part_11
MMRLGRPWRTDSRVDSGQAQSGAGTSAGGKRGKSTAAVADPANVFAVPTMEAVLDWHERCDRGYTRSSSSVRPWDEKREWECSALEWLRQRARMAVKELGGTAGGGGKKETEAAEDVKLWQEQMSTNYKDGNLDLKDLSDVSSLP